VATGTDALALSPATANVLICRAVFFEAHSGHGTASVLDIDLTSFSNA